MLCQKLIHCLMKINIKYRRDQQLNKLHIWLSKMLLRYKQINFDQIKNFQGCMKISSEDSLIKLECRLPDFKNNLDWPLSKSKVHNNKLFQPNKTLSPVISMLKSNKTDNNIFEKTMKEYLEIKQDLNQIEFNKTMNQKYSGWQEIDNIIDKAIDLKSSLHKTGVKLWKVMSNFQKRSKSSEAITKSVYRKEKWKPKISNGVIVLQEIINRILLKFSFKSIIHTSNLINKSSSCNVSPNINTRYTMRTKSSMDGRWTLNNLEGSLKDLSNKQCSKCGKLKKSKWKQQLCLSKQLEQVNPVKVSKFEPSKTTRNLRTSYEDRPPTISGILKNSRTSKVIEKHK